MSDGLGGRCSCGGGAGGSEGDSADFKYRFWRDLPARMRLRSRMSPIEIVQRETLILSEALNAIHISMTATGQRA